MALFLKALCYCSFLLCLLAQCKQDCEPTGIDFITVQFLDKDTQKADTLAFEQVFGLGSSFLIYDKTDRLTFFLLPLPANADGATYVFQTKVNNIITSQALTVSFTRGYFIRTPQCGLGVRYQDLRITFSDFGTEFTQVINPTIQNDALRANIQILR
jgi:hypothetical protein